VEKEYSMGVRMGKKIIENHTWTSNTTPVQKAKESTKGLKLSTRQNTKFIKISIQMESS